ncbi:MAG: hypothetical protein KC609_06500, partial [Myxococcales bacterium]|nr:hypothetical protein [Myxococcales bacterium]
MAIGCKVALPTPFGFALWRRRASYALVLLGLGLTGWHASGCGTSQDGTISVSNPAPGTNGGTTTPGGTTT